MRKLNKDTSILNYTKRNIEDPEYQQLLKKHGEGIQITSKRDIEKEIARCNKEKLLQANNTPLCEEPLLSLLGEQGNFDTGEKTLKGQVQLPDEGMEEGTRLWFNFMTT